MAQAICRNFFGILPGVFTKVEMRWKMGGSHFFLAPGGAAVYKVFDFFVQWGKGELASKAPFLGRLASVFLTEEIERSSRNSGSN